MGRAFGHSLVLKQTWGWVSGIIVFYAHPGASAGRCSVISKEPLGSYKQHRISYAEIIFLCLHIFFSLSHSILGKINKDFTVLKSFSCTFHLFSYDSGPSMALGFLGETLPGCLQPLTSGASAALWVSRGNLFWELTPHAPSHRPCGLGACDRAGRQVVKGRAPGRPGDKPSPHNRYVY